MQGLRKSQFFIYWKWDKFWVWNKIVEHFDKKIYVRESEPVNSNLTIWYVQYLNEDEKHSL